ncbi:MAG: gluconate:proton symporter [Streptococcaceae bacterium]|jgi:hypothetical protein|nr:gluconate:proton symporter [Streptococcaceae bacterium]
MIQLIQGVLLIATFVIFIIFAMRGGNLTVGFLCMAIAWTVIGLIPIKTAMTDIFTTPVINYGKTAIYIILGSWFGRVLVDTGIAGSISRRTAKVGNKAPVIATLLISVVIALIFTSAYGVGSSIAVGVILFPIMFSMGVPKNIAVTVFTLSTGAAMYINPVLFNQFIVFFKGVSWGDKYLKFGFVAMAVQLLITFIFILVSIRKIRNGKPIVLENQEPEAEIKEVSAFTYILPIVPVALSIFLAWDSIPALLLSTILAFLLTGNMKNYKDFVSMMNASAKTAIGDIGGLLIMLFILTMFQAAAVHTVGEFTNIFKHMIPNNPLLLVVIIAIIAPLAYFRGPLMLYGAGAATAAVLTATGYFNGWFLYGLLVVPSMMGISSCVTQSWNLWAVQFTKLDVKTFFKTGMPWAWAATIVNLFVAFNLLK